MISRLISTFVLTFVFLSYSAVAQTTAHLYAAPRAEKISGRLQKHLDEIGPNDSVKVWIFFTDKGFRSPGVFKKALENLDGRFTDKAVQRRLNRSDNPDLFDFHDIPVFDDYVGAIEGINWTVLRRSRWLNAVSAVGRSYGLAEIAALPFVREIRPVASGRRRPVPVVLEKPMLVIPDSVVETYGNSFGQLSQIDVPILHYFGVSGRGVKVALFDTGFDLSLPVFSELNLTDAYDFVDNDFSVDDDTRHGTLTLSLIGGYYPGEMIGSGYGAEYIVARTESTAYEEPIEEDNWVAAAEWADSLGADIISTSLGYYEWYTYEDLDGNSAVITAAADLAVSRGIAVFVSAGNERNKAFYYITPPADGDSVIAVGAVDALGNIASFSSSGPTYDGRIKPEIVAPGVNTYAAVNTGGFGLFSGTSTSAPLAAGVGALLFELHPEWSPIDLREALISSGDRFEDPDNLYGYGLIDALKASRALFVDPVAPVSIKPGDSLNLTFRVTGLADSIPIFSGRNLPETAEFVDNRDRTATLRYLAAQSDAGTFDVVVTAATALFTDTLAFNLSIAELPIITAGPNPFRDSISIFIASAAGQPTDISIFAVNGDKVRDRFADIITGETTTVVWRGTNNEGAEVAPGVYFILVQTEHSVRRIKVFKK